ncbi:hypothetical protein QAD02_005254 [Eretmocerus hayati]|uniref:Uncharacterized protein n=1 Tax=Eretmocerus hayati TaxID=131215 RepID=A0ACC2NUT4_9HYME|nr:hypothetical protein QAD02_024466 [Eretmocerus hayati]KAJ8673992.1 hypothetical protein QAD02_005254 [Eretmocerus hayati]
MEQGDDKCIFLESEGNEGKQFACGEHLIRIPTLVRVVCVASVSSLDNLLHYVIDEVQAGSYKYYSLMYHGSIKIRLTTQSGDADIYVSQTTSKPTYEPDHYCLQSTTCGEDIIYIPRSFKRPVSIGVYGHPSYETSSYTLLVYQVNDLQGEILTDENLEDDNLHGSQTPKVGEH